MSDTIASGESDIEDRNERRNRYHRSHVNEGRCATRYYPIIHTSNTGSLLELQITDSLDTLTNPRKAVRDCRNETMLRDAAIDRQLYRNGGDEIYPYRFAGWQWCLVPTSGHVSFLSWQRIVLL